MKILRTTCNPGAQISNLLHRKASSLRVACARRSTGAEQVARGPSRSAAAADLPCVKEDPSAGALRAAADRGRSAGRCWGTSFGAMVVCLLAISACSGAAEQDTNAVRLLQGTWRWNFTMPDGTTIRPKLKLSEENGQLTGTTNFRPGSDAAVTNLMIEGDQIRFRVVRQREGNEIVTAYTGTWTSNAIHGRIESNWAGDTQTFPWEAQRGNLGADGMWRWTNSFPGQGGFGRGGGRGFENRVELEQHGTQIRGKTAGRFGTPTEISNGVMTNGVIHFEIERNFGGNKILTSYEGTQKGDVIKGTMTREIEGEDVESEWEARRVD